MQSLPASRPAGDADRGWREPSYATAERELLLRHVINLADGKLMPSGDFATSPQAVAALFERHLPAAVRAARNSGQKLRVLFWAHGGLVPERNALDLALAHAPVWQRAGIYPIYFVWETGFMETLSSLIRGGGTRAFITDSILEYTLADAGSAFWSRMKDIAQRASGADGGAAKAAEFLGKFVAKHQDAVTLYAAGHSAGSIFHSHWLPVAIDRGAKFEELFLLAPAATTRLFSERLQPLIRSGGPIRRCSMFTMRDDLERADHVGYVYRKSLLYFVSNACEPRRREPILGMEACVREDPSLRQFFGIDGHASAHAEIVLSRSPSEDGIAATRSVSHGNFDNDPPTLNSLARRMLGNPAVRMFDDSNSGDRSNRPTGARLLGGDGTRAPDDALASAKANRRLTVEIAVVCADIVAYQAPKGSAPVAYRAAGHYDATPPWGAEKALDEWISTPARDSKRQTATDAGREKIVAGMTRRGSMPGGLGQTVLLPAANGGFAVFLGLGKSGTLGPGELTMAVRELLLSLPQNPGTHLATVLIGAGEGNMTQAAAATAWLRAIQQVQKDSPVTKITFVECDEFRYLQTVLALGEALKYYRSSDPTGNPLPNVKSAMIEKWAKSASQKAASNARARVAEFRNSCLSLVGAAKPGKAASDSAADAAGGDSCRISVRAEKDCCVFSALTDSAAIPERTVRVDLGLVEEVSAALANAIPSSRSFAPAEDLVEWGKTLQQILIPRDLHSSLFSSAAPLVLILDSTMARIPWELLTIPGRERLGSAPDTDSFLGTAETYGVTRQFQTSFAPLPERNDDPQRTLSVMIVADPAPDAALAGAMREADELEEVVRKIRPEAKITVLKGAEATRAKLARELCNHPYDILHFAGHCCYNKSQPDKSGWIFKANPLTVFSANEILRLDRVPPFVFSNACESGVTPDRAHLANRALAPAFAEAFFAKGVGNLICTAWPVGDEAALRFATSFYRNAIAAPNARPVTLRAAILNARRDTWELSPKSAGAYQHYGDPSKHLFTRYLPNK